MASLTSTWLSNNDVIVCFKGLHSGALHHHVTRVTMGHPKEGGISHMSQDSVAIWSEETLDGRFIGCFRILHLGEQIAQDQTVRSYATRCEAEEAARNALRLAKATSSGADMASPA